MKKFLVAALAAVSLAFSTAPAALAGGYPGSASPAPSFAVLGTTPVYPSSTYQHRDNATQLVLDQYGRYLYGYTNNAYFQCDVFGSACWGAPTTWTVRYSSTQELVYAVIYNNYYRNYVVYQAMVVGPDSSMSISGSTTTTGAGSY